MSFSSSPSNSNGGGWASLTNADFNANGTNDPNSSLQNVFSTLGNIAETKAQNDQRRGQEDLANQSQVYQNFDTTAANRTAGIDTAARQQTSDLTENRMRLQSSQNMAEEQNRGKVQVSTTGATRDADLQRALSVLPRQ